MIFSLLGYMVSVTTIQLCCYSVKAAIDYMQTKECGCFPIEFYLQNWLQATFGPMGLSLPCVKNNVAL